VDNDPNYEYDIYMDKLKVYSSERERVVNKMIDEFYLKEL
jgi:hypothetical protein